MSELTNEQIAAGAAVIGDNGRPIGRNTAIMVADAMFPIQSPAPIPEQVAQAESGAKEMAEQLRRYHELEVWDWDILLNAANTIERLLATQSAKQAPSAQEVTQQAAKAETAEQANVLPPTRGTDSQHNADPYDVIEFALELAENKGNQDAMDFLAAWWWETNDDFLRVHWPDFAKLELASRCRAQGGNTNTESSDLAPTTSTVSASGNSSKNSSSSEGDQAAPDDVRNQALEDAKEASEILESFIDNVSTDGPYGAEATLTFIGQAKQCVDGAIHALITTAAQAATDKSED